ncbi:Uncharacterised protein [Edwardsiella hoshinae]|uniref:Uncharacterized protein n=1 Tax=Edwardsiella hoshinae TaxID=93378 RepID=A0A376D622_9GAMM|nr:Uncharacterised protein [Edwardsiella hoshinae]
MITFPPWGLAKLAEIRHVIYAVMSYRLSLAIIYIRDCLLWAWLLFPVKYSVLYCLMHYM